MSNSIFRFEIFLNDGGDRYEVDTANFNFVGGMWNDDGRELDIEGTDKTWFEANKTAIYTEVNNYLEDLGSPD